MSSLTSIGSLLGMVGRLLSLMLSWLRWRLLKPRSGLVLTGSSSAWSTGAARLVPASAGAVAVQPRAARAGRVDQQRPAAARSLGRRGRRSARRRDAARARQLRRLPAAKRLRG